TTLSLLEASTNDSNSAYNNSFFTTPYYTVINETIIPSTPFKDEYNTFYSENLTTQDVNSTAKMSQSTFYTELQNNSITPSYQQQVNITETHTESYINSSGIENINDSFLSKTKISNDSIEFFTSELPEISNISEMTTPSLKLPNSTDQFNDTNRNLLTIYLVGIPKEQTNSSGDNLITSTTNEFSTGNAITPTSKTTKSSFNNGNISTGYFLLFL
ncbi:hypothetical protein MXB_2841, partial [Myxobolus squamalis]